MRFQTYKREFVTKPCPWCGRTPRFNLSPNPHQINDETWLWYIKCENPSCTMQPKTKGVPVRNTSQYILSKQIEKVQKMVDMWNDGNPTPPRDKTIVEFKIDLNKNSINRMKSGTSEPVFIEWNDIRKKKPEWGGRFLVFMECENRIHNCLAYDYPYPCCSVNIMYWNGQQWYTSSEGKEVTSYVKKWAKIPKVA